MTIKKMLNLSQVKILMKMLTSEDVESSQFSVIIRTLILTGLRASECLALQWGDVDFENSVISVKHNLCYDGKKLGSIYQRQKIPPSYCYVGGTR